MKETIKSNRMGTQKMFPLLMSMAIPPMLSMLIQSLYNIVDSMFVARIGEEALTAVSLAFPLQNLTLSVAVGTGVGINSYIARNLGSGNGKEAGSTVIHGFILTAVHYIIIFLFGILFIPAFFHGFTDNEIIYRYCCQYGYIVILLSFGQMFHITIEKIFQAEGKMMIPMIMQCVGAVTNIILDPILIFGLFGMPKLGVAGAAIATVIGQFSSCLLSFVLYYFCRSEIKVDWKNPKFSLEIIKKIYIVAIPSSVMMALASFLVMGLNAILKVYGNTAISVFGIYYKLQTFVYMPANGLVQGIRPIIGYNYGASDKERLYSAIRLSMAVIGIIMLAGTIGFLAIPELILKMFHADGKMLKMGIPALRIICIGFLFSTAGIVIAAFFESIGKGGQSLAISLLRQFLIILPLAAVLSPLIGITGIWITFPVAETTAAIAAFILFFYTLKKDKVFQKNY